MKILSSIYISEVVDYVLLGVVYYLQYSAARGAKPYCRPFSWSDSSISHPFVESRSSTTMQSAMLVGSILFYVILISICFPLPKQGLTYAVFRPRRLWKHPDIHLWIKAQVTAVVVCSVVTTGIKLASGHLRPDYLSRVSLANFTGAYADLPLLSNSTVFCDLRLSQSILRDGMMAFPSARASMNSAVFTVLGLFIFTALKPCGSSLSFSRLCASLAPLAVPVIIEVFSFHSNRHHMGDLAVGCFIGVSAAFLGVFSIIDIFLIGKSDLQERHDTPPSHLKSVECNAPASL